MKAKGLLLLLVFVANCLRASNDFTMDSILSIPCNANTLSILDGQERLEKKVMEIYNSLDKSINRIDKLSICIAVDTLGQPIKVNVRGEYSLQPTIIEEIKKVALTMKCTPIINCGEINVGVCLPFVFKNENKK